MEKKTISQSYFLESVSRANLQTVIGPSAKARKALGLEKGFVTADTLHSTMRDIFYIPAFGEDKEADPNDLVTKFYTEFGAEATHALLAFGFKEADTFPAKRLISINTNEPIVTAGMLVVEGDIRSTSTILTRGSLIARSVEVQVDHVPKYNVKTIQVLRGDLVVQKSLKALPVASSASAISVHGNCTVMDREGSIVAGVLEIGANLRAEETDLKVTELFVGGNMTADELLCRRVQVGGAATLKGNLQSIGASADVDIGRECHVGGLVRANGSMYVGQNMSVQGDLEADRVRVSQALKVVGSIKAGRGGATTLRGAIRAHAIESGGGISADSSIISKTTIKAVGSVIAGESITAPGGLQVEGQVIAGIHGIPGRVSCPTKPANLVFGEFQQSRPVADTGPSPA